MANGYQWSMAHPTTHPGTHDDVTIANKFARPNIIIVVSYPPTRHDALYNDARCWWGLVLLIVTRETARPPSTCRPYLGTGMPVASWLPPSEGYQDECPKYQQQPGESPTVQTVARECR